MLAALKNPTCCDSIIPRRDQSDGQLRQVLGKSLNGGPLAKIR